MRFLYVGVVLMMTAGSLPAATQPTATALWITISDGRGHASILVARSEVYVDSPSAGLGVGTPVPRGTAPDLMFSIRSWKEGNDARVVVYARLEDRRAPGGRTETPIATFAIGAGQSVEVRESEAWGGPRYVISAEIR